MDKKYIEYPKKFDKKSYDKQYRKENYKQFSTVIRPEIKDRIDDFCKDEGISRAEYLVQSIDLMEKYGRK